MRKDQGQNVNGYTQRNPAERAPFKASNEHQMKDEATVCSYDCFSDKRITSDCFLLEQLDGTKSCAHFAL